MYPSCSDYSRQAIEKYGSIIGAMVVADRLMRCGRDELNLARMIYVNGKLRFYDPLENNTFWWDKNL